ncbi:hypothetical protein [Streptomyces sp. enrichment culture]|uniref:hypothetical protein n=1 Tax=Streptomyces sp. enrichment culture TaxID=1795815 RepID=UPI003F550375
MALVAECVLALVVFVIAFLREEEFYFADMGAPLGWILGALILVGAAGLVGAVGSAVVLPLVWLSRRWARGAGRDDTAMRCLAVCAAFAAVTGVGAGAVWALGGGDGTALGLVAPVVFLVVTPPALCARAATAVRRTGARLAVAVAVAVAGAALSAAVAVGGVVAYATGLLEPYEPPRLTAEQLVGTWTDERGGTLTLRADGTAVADDLGAVERCSGSGSWERSDGQPEPELRLWGSSCLEETYAFSGTEEQPRLHHLFGDAEAPDRYILRRS